MINTSVTKKIYILTAHWINKEAPKFMGLPRIDAMQIGRVYKTRNGAKKQLVRLRKKGFPIDMHICIEEYDI